MDRPYRAPAPVRISGTGAEVLTASDDLDAGLGRTAARAKQAGRIQPAWAFPREGT